MMKLTYSNWRNQYTLKLRKRLGKPAFRDWDIQCRELFGRNTEAEQSSDESHTPGDIYCLTLWHCTHFLDEVKSVADLTEGLFQLSPFAEDALEVALCMSETDFIEFKLALVQERKAARGEGGSMMPERYHPNTSARPFSRSNNLGRRGESFSWCGFDTAHGNRIRFIIKKRALLLVFFSQNLHFLNYF